MLRRIAETVARTGSFHDPGNKRGGPGDPMITAINSIDVYAITPIGANPFVPALFAFLVANANCVVVNIITLLAEELPFLSCDRFNRASDTRRTRGKCRCSHHDGWSRDIAVGTGKPQSKN